MRWIFGGILGIRIETVFANTLTAMWHDRVLHFALLARPAVLRAAMSHYIIYGTPYIIISAWKRYHQLFRPRDEIENMFFFRGKMMILRKSLKLIKILKLFGKDADVLVITNEYD